MATVAADITTRTAELADMAFDSFCDDIAGMFGSDMKCERRQVSMESVQVLNTHFKKLAVVHVVQGRGALDGQFQLLFDQGGLFILSGVVVMLPQARILEEIKRGSIESVEHFKDPAQEVGNLLVGSWDRVFRASCKGHQHFLKAATCIGKPLDNPAVTGLSAGTEVLLAMYEMTVESYPTFKCAAVFPKAMLAGMAAATEEPAEPEATEEPAPVAKSPPAAPPVVPLPSVQAKPEPPKQVAPEPPKAEPTRPSPSPAPAAAPPTPTPAKEPPAPEKAVVHQAPPVPVVPPTIVPPPAADPEYVRSSHHSQDSSAARLLHKTAAEIMDKKVVWATPENTVQDVLALMQQHNCGYILIGTNGVIEGLMSRSDVLGAVSLYLRPVFAKWRRPEDDATLGVKVKWIMSRPVRTVRTDTTLVAMIECMRHFGGRCLPIVDEQGVARGIVTVFEILLYVADIDNSFSWKGGAPAAPALI
jgi:CBS domain-containing protein